MPNAKQNLVIVESPSKAKTIGKYLGPDYQVKASMGHLRDLPKSTPVSYTHLDVYKRQVHGQDPRHALRHRRHGQP